MQLDSIYTHKALIGFVGLNPVNRIHYPAEALEMAIILNDLQSCSIHFLKDHTGIIPYGGGETHCFQQK